MKVPISGQVTGNAEARNVMQVAFSKHYGGGVWVKEFEKLFSNYMEQRYAIMCNSGSSAMLLALSALELPERSRIVTCAVNFPTTINAIIQLGHIPVFVDADPRTLNIAPYKCEADAAIVAHTLGNPARIQYEDNLIEDCCDAIGSRIGGLPVGMLSDVATASFYPAHHITTGEGGMCLVDDIELKIKIQSYRDWGKACWCEPGQDNKCGKRYDGDYDHKYTFSKIGYNLKASDLQAAVGVAQMDRLEQFTAIRRENYDYYRENLSGISHIQFVESIVGAKPSWFGFPFLTEDRNKLARYLDDNEIGNRPIMGGNLLRQPAYKDVEHDIIGKLDGANLIHENGLWIGVFPGITKEMMDYTIEKLRVFYE